MKRKLVMAELKRHIIETLHINLVVDEINALFSLKGIPFTGISLTPHKHCLSVGSSSIKSQDKQRAHTDKYKTRQCQIAPWAITDVDFDYRKTISYKQCCRLKNKFVHLLSAIELLYNTCVTSLFSAVCSSQRSATCCDWRRRSEKFTGVFPL